MSATAPETMAQRAPTTAIGIPIRNLWHMLLYAWKDLAFKDRWKTEVESAPTLDALFASLLVNLLHQRLRLGLGRSYTEEAKRLHGIRGRIDFATSLQQRAFENGQVHCCYQAYSYNVPKNQIIRSTLARLVHKGAFGPNRKQANEMRQRLRRMVRSLDGVDLIELTVDCIRRQQLGRNDADYRLMLAICALLLQRHMPTETAGVHDLPGLDRDGLMLSRIYERFVANFYTLHLHGHGWVVTPQARLRWPLRQASPSMPMMAPDLILQHRTTGHLVILDTKFTANSLLPTRWGKEVFDASHLYQMYAYLRSQEQVSVFHRQASGILLYPAVRRRLSENVELQGHQLRVVTLDLSQSWEEIENELLTLMSVAVNESCPSTSPLPSGES